MCELKERKKEKKGRKVMQGTNEKNCPCGCVAHGNGARKREKNDWHRIEDRKMRGK